MSLSGSDAEGPEPWPEMERQLTRESAFDDAELTLLPVVATTDCDGNGRGDLCDLLEGADDCDGNGIPDTCQADCNGNGIADPCDIASGTSDDLLLEDGTYSGFTFTIGRNVTLRAQHTGQAVLDGEDTRRVMVIADVTVDLQGLNITRGKFYSDDVGDPPRTLPVHHMRHCSYDMRLSPVPRWSCLTPAF